MRVIWNVVGFFGRIFCQGQPLFDALSRRVSQIRISQLAPAQNLCIGPGWKSSDCRSLVWLGDNRHCCHVRFTRGLYAILFFCLSHNWQTSQNPLRTLLLPSQLCSKCCFFSFLRRRGGTLRQIMQTSDWRCVLFGTLLAFWGEFLVRVNHFLTL